MDGDLGMEGAVVAVALAVGVVVFAAARVVEVVDVVAVAADADGEMTDGGGVAAAEGDGAVGGLEAVGRLDRNH